MSWQQQKESALAFVPDYSYNYNPDFQMPRKLPDTTLRTAWKPGVPNLPTSEAELYYPHNASGFYRTGEMPEVRIYQAPLFIQVPRRGWNRVGAMTSAPTSHMPRADWLPLHEVEENMVKDVPMAPLPPPGYPLGRRVVEPPDNAVEFGKSARPRISRF